MTTTVSVAELRVRTHLTTDEAVAIVQQLIQGIRTLQGPSSAEPLVGPPSVENVHLSRDGSVSCSSFHTTPSVFEIAILLHSLLPQGTMARGGLRYTIARALLEVDVPPFDSVQEFSEALARFERVDRGDLIREVVARWHDSERAAWLAFPAALDRRHARRYQQSLANAPAVETRVQMPSKRFRFLPAFGACFAAGGMMIATSEVVQLRPGVDVVLPAVAPPAVASADPALSSGLQLPELPAVAMQSAARREVVKRPVKFARPAESRSDRTDVTKRVRRGPSRGLLEKLRLQWLKKAFS